MSACSASAQVDEVVVLGVPETAARTSILTHHLSLQGLHPLTEDDGACMPLCAAMHVCWSLCLSLAALSGACGTGRRQPCISRCTFSHGTLWLADV
jgi:hypothetical protein